MNERLNEPLSEVRRHNQKTVVARRTQLYWALWTKQVVDWIEENDWGSAVDMLVGNTFEFSFSKADKQGCRDMYKHPVIIAHAEVLWPRMEPAILKECRTKIRKDLTKMGWPP